MSIKTALKNMFTLLAITVVMTGCEVPDPGDWGDFVSKGGTTFLGALIVFAVLIIITKIASHSRKLHCRTN